MTTKIEVIESEESKGGLGSFDNPSAAGLAIMQAATAGAQKALLSVNNVDNTSDATKNAATATLTNKTLTSPVINTPTGIVKGDVGLGNVDNTSDAGKPVSTATQTALDLKANAADVPAARTFVTLTATATLTANADHTIDSTTAAATLTLPSAATSIGKDVGVINISASTNAITLAGAGAAKIIGLSTYVMQSGTGGQWTSLTLTTNGTDWFIK